MAAYYLIVRADTVEIYREGEGWVGGPHFVQGTAYSSREYATRRAAELGPFAYVVSRSEVEEGTRRKTGKDCRMPEPPWARRKNNA